MVAEQLVAVDLDRAKHLPPAERQQALRQFGAALAGLPISSASCFRSCRAFSCSLEKFGIADDHGQQIVEVVGDAAGELADGLHLLRLDELLLGALALGQIVDDADENRLAVLLRLADRQVHREGRAVLALADHLAADADDLASAGAVIIVEIAIVLVAIRRRHQHLDVLADDLARPIAEQRLAGRIEHQDTPRGVDQDHAVDRGRRPPHRYRHGLVG